MNSTDFAPTSEKWMIRQGELYRCAAFFDDPHRLGFYGLAAVSSGANPDTFQLPTDYPDPLAQSLKYIATINDLINNGEPVPLFGHIDYLLAASLQQLTKQTFDPQKLLTLADNIKIRMAHCYDDPLEPGIPIVNSVVAKLRDTAYEHLYPSTFQKVRAAIENASGVDMANMYHVGKATRLIQEMLEESLGAIDWNDITLIGNVKPMLSRIQALVAQSPRFENVGMFLDKNVPQLSEDELAQLFWMQKDGLRGQTYPKKPASFDALAGAIKHEVQRSEHNCRLLPHKSAYGLKPYAYIKQSLYPENELPQFHKHPIGLSPRKQLVALQNAAIESGVVSYAALHSLLFLPVRVTTNNSATHTTHYPVELMVRMGTRGLRAMERTGSQILRAVPPKNPIPSYAKLFGYPLQSLFSTAKEELKLWM